MNQFPSLPLPDAQPHPESEDLTIEFKHREFGGCSAILRNEYGDKVDEIREDSFENAYATVQLNYPQAKWEAPDEEEAEPFVKTVEERLAPRPYGKLKHSKGDYR